MVLPSRRLPLCCVGLLFTAGLASCDADGLVDEHFTSRLQLVSFQPQSGTPDGGESVTLIGRNFRPDDRVFFGQQHATDVDFQGDSALVVVSPPGNFGPAELRICRPGGGCVAFETPYRYKAAEVRLAFHEDLGRAESDAAFAAGDFDGNGQIDLAAATSGHLREYAGSDTGFRLHSQPSVPRALDFTEPCPGIAAISYTLAEADFHDDSAIDLVLSVYRDQNLYRMEGIPGTGLAEPVATSHPELLELCYNHVLVPADLDADGVQDLVVLNLTGDPQRRSTLPDHLGPVGALLSFDTPAESTVVLPDLLTCDFVHSYGIRRGPPDGIRLLCERAGDLIDLVLVLGANGLEVASERFLRALPEGERRFHFIELDGDAESEIVGLRGTGPENGTSRQEYSAELGRPGPSGEWSDLGTFDFGCTFRPELVAADLTPADGVDELVILCPSDDVIQHAFLDTGDRLDVVSQQVFLDKADLRGPDFSMCYEDGQPLQPSLAAMDTDGDGRDELLLPGRWGDARLVRAHPIPGRRMPRFSAMATPPGGDPPHGDMTSWSPARTYQHGRPTGMLVDLNHDGQIDLLRLFSRPSVDHLRGGLQISLGAPEAGFSPPQVVLWDSTLGRIYSQNTMFIENLNDDGLDDVMLLVRDASGTLTGLEFVLSSPTGYTYAGGQLLDSSVWPDHIQVESVSAGRVRLAVWGADGAPGLFHFEGSAHEPFQVLPEPIRGLEFPGGLWELLDLDNDGALDLLGSDGRMCWGREFEACLGPEAGERLFSSELSDITSLSVTFDQRQESWQLLVLDENGARGQWLTMRDRQADLRTFRLDSLSMYAVPMETGRACDMDGDGIGDPIFLFMQPNQVAPSLAALRTSEDQPDTVEWVPLGLPDVSMMELACTDWSGQGLDDLVLDDYYGALYWVPNRSR